MITSVATSDNEWYNEWQQMVQRMTTTDSKWQWVAANDSEWYNKWKQMGVSKTVILSFKMQQRANVVPE